MTSAVRRPRRAAQLFPPAQRQPPGMPAPQGEQRPEEEGVIRVMRQASARDCSQRPVGSRAAAQARAIQPPAWAPPVPRQAVGRGETSAGGERFPAATSVASDRCCSRSEEQRRDRSATRGSEMFPGASAEARQRVGPPPAREESSPGRNRCRPDRPHPNRAAEQPTGRSTEPRAADAQTRVDPDPPGDPPARPTATWPPSRTGCLVRRDDLLATAESARPAVGAAAAHAGRPQPPDNADTEPGDPRIFP